MVLACSDTLVLRNRPSHSGCLIPCYQAFLKGTDRGSLVSGRERRVACLLSEHWAEHTGI
jgi:hypothetical protein